MERIIIPVTTVQEQKQVMNNIYSQLTIEPSCGFRIRRKVNTITVLHISAPDIYTSVREYLVVVIPMLINLSPLRGLSGKFHTEYLQNRLDAISHEITALQKIQVGQEGADGIDKITGRLAESLR